MVENPNVNLVFRVLDEAGRFLPELTNGPLPTPWVFVDSYTINANIDLTEVSIFHTFSKLRCFFGRTFSNTNRFGDPIFSLEIVLDDCHTVLQGKEIQSLGRRSKWARQAKMVWKRSVRPNPEGRFSRKRMTMDEIDKLLRNGWKKVDSDCVFYNGSQNSAYNSFKKILPTRSWNDMLTNGENMQCYCCDRHGGVFDLNFHLVYEF